MPATDIYIEQRKLNGYPPKLTANHREPPEIEHGIPFPSGVRRRGGARAFGFSHFYPFEDMLPGDSFWVPGKSRGCTFGAVTRFSKKTGWRFASRSQTKEGVPNKEAPDLELHGIRVWRIS